MMDEYLEAAALPIKKYLADILDERDVYLMDEALLLAKAAVEAWVGDRDPLYQIDPNQRDGLMGAIYDALHTADMPYTQKQAGQLFDRIRQVLVRVSVTEGEPT
jgi:hypothetical protein